MSGKDLKLNLGCGEHYLEGYVNCDLLPHVRADQHFDLNQPPYPFVDGTVDEILMDNVLEHLDDLLAVMGELHRILKPGGVLRAFVPYGKSDWAMQDPTHKHFFTEQTIRYFCSDWEYAFYGTFEFRLKHWRFISDNRRWRQRLRNLIPFRSVLRYFLFNMYDVIYFELEKPVGSAPARGSVPEGQPS
jgi:SAM-dependent methyltransferase